MDWKTKRKAEGWADKLVWLNPEAVGALATLKAKYPGESEGDIISRALAKVAGYVDYEVTEQQVLEERVSWLENAVRELQGQGAKPKGPGAGSVQRKGGGKRGSRWQADLVEYSAQAWLHKGPNFNINGAWQWMQQNGIEAHTQGSGYYTWLKKPHNWAEVEERVRKLKADQDKPQYIPGQEP